MADSYDVPPVSGMPLWQAGMCLKKQSRIMSGYLLLSYHKPEINVSSGRLSLADSGSIRCIRLCGAQSGKMFSYVTDAGSDVFVGKMPASCHCRQDQPESSHQRRIYHITGCKSGEGTGVAAGYRPEQGRGKAGIFAQ